MRKIPRAAESLKNSSQVGTGQMNSIQKKANPRTNSGRRAAKWKARAVPQSCATEVGGGDPSLRDEGVEVAHVILESICDVWFARLTKADEVRSNTMRDLGDMGMTLRHR